MQLVTFDFETYFDREYSLKKMTTEEYVRDSRFKVHCAVGMLEGDSAIVLDPVGHQGNWKTYAVLCHHAHFDGLILSHHYGIKPAFWFDTLSMARLVLPNLKSHSLESLANHFGLGTKTVPYNLFIGKRELDQQTQNLLEEGCKHDVELTYEIFKRLLPFVSQEELRVIDLTIRMFTEPSLVLDMPRMQAYLAKTIEDKKALLEKCGVREEDLSSSNKFATVLQTLGISVPTKISARTGKETFALAKTDEGFKELCNSEDDVIVTLCAARLGVKSTIAETRAGRLIGAADRGCLPVYLKYYGAHTGRWSGGDKTNWQNFQRGGEIRKSILAPEGYVLVVVDLSQIECRMLNWLAGEENVLSAFRAGRDLYCETASRFYGRTITKADKAERQIFKNVELGCGYGMGADKFKTYARAAGSPVDDVQAKELIQFYRHTHGNVCRYWREAERMIQAIPQQQWTTWGPMKVGFGRIVYPNGGYTMYEQIEKGDGGYSYWQRRARTKLYGGRLVENVTQALSRVLLSQAMLKIAQKYKVVISTHDEVGYLASESEAEEAYNFGLNVLTTAPEWCNDIPLGAEGGYARNYSK